MYAKEIITDPRIVKFWEEAICKGAHLKPPSSSKISAECWDWRLGVTLECVFTNRTLRAIALDHKICYEYVRRISQNMTHAVWKNCDEYEYLKKKYPRYKLKLRRISAKGDIAA